MPRDPRRTQAVDLTYTHLQGGPKSNPNPFIQTKVWTSLDTQVLKTFDSRPTKENSTTMKHTG